MTAHASAASVPGLGRSQILLDCEQQGNVDRHARGNCFFNGWQTRWGARDFDEQIVAARLAVQLSGRLNGGVSVVGEQGRNLK